MSDLRSERRPGMAALVFGMGALACLSTCQRSQSSTGDGFVSGGGGATRPGGGVGGAIGGPSFSSTAEIVGELPVGPTATAVATGDFDGNALADVALALGPTNGAAESSIVVLFQDSPGQFGAPSTVATTDDELSALLAGDVNGDGLDDLVGVTGNRELAMVSLGGSFAPAVVLPRPPDAGPTREATLVNLGDGGTSAAFLAEGAAGTRTLFVVSNVSAGPDAAQLSSWPEVFTNAHLLNSRSHVLRGNLTPTQQFLYVAARDPLQLLWFKGGDGQGGLLAPKVVEASAVGVSAPIGALETENTMRGAVIFTRQPSYLVFLGSLVGTSPCTMPAPSALSMQGDMDNPVFVGYVPAPEIGTGNVIAGAFETSATDGGAITFFGVNVTSDLGSRCNGFAGLTQLTAPLGVEGPIIAKDAVNLGTRPAVVVVHGPVGTRHTTLISLSQKLVATKPLPEASSPGADSGISDAGSPPDAGLDGAGGSGPTTQDAPVTQVCEWVVVSMCDTGVSLESFCGKDRVAASLSRCDGTTTVPPDGIYGANRLCGCDGGKLGGCCEGVPFQAVNCCYP